MKVLVLLISQIKAMSSLYKRQALLLCFHWFTKLKVTAFNY